MNLQCILKGSCLFSSFICNVPLSKHYFTRRFCFSALAGETCIEPFQPSFGPSKPVVCNVLQNRFSPVTFAKFLRTPFLQNISGGYNWLLSIFAKKVIFLYRVLNTRLCCTPQTQDINWTTFLRSIYVLCLRGICYKAEWSIIITHKQLPALSQ